MTIATVAVDDPVQASTMNDLIANVNGSPGRQVFTANGTFSVPEGVHQFKVSICGAGGGSGAPGSYYASEEYSATAGGNGGVSPLVSAIVSGQEPGSSFSVTVGAGGAGTGGSSSFGTLLTVAGGGAGGAGPSAPGVGSTGSTGAISGSLSGSVLRHTNSLFLNGSLLAYGSGGAGSSAGTNNGIDGIVVVEW